MTTQEVIKLIFLKKCPPGDPLSIILISLTSLGNGYFGTNSMSWPLGIIYIYISYAVHNNRFRSSTTFNLWWYFIHNNRKCTVNIFLWLGQWFWGYSSGFILFDAFFSNANAHVACGGTLSNMCSNYFSGICIKWGILKLMPTTFLLLKNKIAERGTLVHISSRFNVFEEASYNPGIRYEDAMIFCIKQIKRKLVLDYFAGTPHYKL